MFVARAGAKLIGFYLFAILAHSRSASADLRRLAELVAGGRVDPQIDIVRPWTEAGEAIEALMDRRVAGKAVLTRLLTAATRATFCESASRNDSRQHGACIADSLAPVLRDSLGIAWALSW